MGSVSLKGRFKLEFISKTKIQRSKANKCFCSKPYYYTAEGRQIVKKVQPSLSLLARCRSVYSNFFLVPKNSGELRPVINVRILIRYLIKTTFQIGFYQQSSEVGKTMRFGNLSRSQGRVSSYISRHRSHMNYLRFCIQGKASQFTALCFRPSLAPRCFTKLISVVAARLRIDNIRLALYLDDWFLVNQKRKV